MNQRQNKKTIKEKTEELVKTDILEEFKEDTENIISKIQQIIKELKRRQSKIAIIIHNSPDPDAISSAMGLKKIFKEKGVKYDNIDIYADGEPTREAKVIKDRLGISTKLAKKFNQKQYKTVVLIDAPSLRQTNIINQKVNIDLIIDHHNGETLFGSSAAIITLLMKILDVTIEEEIATALYVGIATDTNDLTSKKSGKYDMMSYFKILSPLIDNQLRKEIIKSGHSESYRNMLNNALGDYYHKVGSIVISGVGYIDRMQKVNLAKVANFLLDEEGVEKVVVLAIVEEQTRDKQGNILESKKFIVPATRSSTGTESAGDLNRKVFGKKSGGDTEKASGEIPIEVVYPGIIGRIKRAKADKNENALKGYFIDILNRFKDQILEQQTK